MQFTAPTYHHADSRSEWSDAWTREAGSFVRAFSGAFLFGIPLLLTMEMWWLGETSGTGQLLLVTIVMLLANFWFAAAVGFRRESSLYSKIEQAIDAVAVGVVAAIVVLAVLNELSLEQSLHTLVGKIVFQALPLSLGASLANAVFDRGGSRDGDDLDDADSKDGPSPGVWKALFNDLGATAIGAIFIAAAIAPTEEVLMLAGRMSLFHLLALIALTLGLGYIVVFASGFDPSSAENRKQLFQHPVTETSLAYLVSLLVAFGTLLLTQHVGLGDPPAYVLAQTLVLGLPAMVGGAAGRIAI